ncbi:MAG: phosphatidylserine decarboxylase family protein [Bacteroidota bacterium]
MSIHREGIQILVIALIILVVTNLVWGRLCAFSGSVYIGLCIASLFLYGWLLAFFRNPCRVITPQAQVVLAPADGTVVAIQTAQEDEYLQQACIQVSIFMSPFNVHVNRSPVTGTIQYFKHHPGRYWVAFHPKSSTQNEHTTVVVKRTDGTLILFRQIAGFVARRIKFYPQPDASVQQGDEVGFIKFGSRLDLFLPTHAALVVQRGDRVRAGVSAIATLATHNTPLK